MRNETEDLMNYAHLKCCSIDVFIEHMTKHDTVFNSKINLMDLDIRVEWVRDLKLYFVSKTEQPHMSISMCVVPFVHRHFISAIDSLELLPNANLIYEKLLGIAFGL